MLSTFFAWLAGLELVQLAILNLNGRSETSFRSSPRLDLSRWVALACCKQQTEPLTMLLFMRNNGTRSYEIAGNLSDAVYHWSITCDIQLGQLKHKDPLRVIHAHHYLLSAL